MHLPGNKLLSVIIPTINEAENLPGLLDDLKQQENITLEIIVGDGGSTDATRLIAESYGATFVSSKRGRGAQMNAATLKASGKYYLFLHADSRVDDVNLFSNALQALTDEYTEQYRIAGHFRLRFIRSTPHNAVAYRYAEEKTAFNRVNTTNGDQGLMLYREFFEQLGGFDESMPFLEDQRIAEKIRSQGTWITLPGFLKTSARRFEAEGFHRRYTLMSIMMGLYSVGELDFFVRAPGIYQVQQNTGKLYLSPFFGLIWRMICYDWGIWRSARIFYLLGRYIRQNSWQMFFFIDVLLHNLLGEARYPFLCLHDRVIAPCTNFKVFNALVGIFCFIWFMGILAPFYAVIDFRGQRYNAI